MRSATQQDTVSGNDQEQPVRNEWGVKLQDVSSTVSRAWESAGAFLNKSSSAVGQFASSQGRNRMHHITTSGDGGSLFGNFNIYQGE